MRGPGRAGEGLSLTHQQRPPTGQPPICPAGYTICHHPQAVSQMGSSANTSLLICSKHPVSPRPGPHTSHPPAKVGMGACGMGLTPTHST